MPAPGIPALRPQVEGSQAQDPVGVPPGVLADRQRAAAGDRGVPAPPPRAGDQPRTADDHAGPVLREIGGRPERQAGAVKRRAGRQPGMRHRAVRRLGHVAGNMAKAEPLGGDDAGRGRAGQQPGGPPVPVMPGPRRRGGQRPHGERLILPEMPGLFPLEQRARQAMQLPGIRPHLPAGLQPQLDDDRQGGSRSSGSTAGHGAGVHLWLVSEKRSYLTGRGSSRWWRIGIQSFP